MMFINSSCMPLMSSRLALHYSKLPESYMFAALIHLVIAWQSTGAN